MTRKLWTPFAAIALLASPLGCSDDGNGGGGDTDVSDGDTATDSTPTDSVTDSDTVADTDATDTVGPAACDLPANAAHRQALLAAQPTIEGRARDAIDAQITWSSLEGDPSVSCAVSLSFKDSNDNGALDPYEDWTLSPEERAADLVVRMSEADKIGLMAHATTSDAPTSASSAVSAALQSMIQQDHLRYGLSTASSGQLGARATWANNVQELCEATPLAIPFVISMRPSHSIGDGRVKAAGFSRWPHELGLGATGTPSVATTFGRVVSQEYRAIGVRMALEVPADLATEPRWYMSQFTFGEDSAAVAAMLEAYVTGLQGETLDAGGVAAVVGHFPGAGPATDGWEGRLEKGRYLRYPGDNFDAHAAPFAAAIEAGAAAVMLAHGIPETGDWSGLSGVVDGATLEQVGVPFNDTLVGAALRDHLGFDGLVIAPWGVLDEPGAATLGAPWGVESLTPAERVAKAVGAGIDQFGGLADPAPIAEARAAGLLSDAQLDAAAARALVVMFRLGLFEDPYVDVAQAPALVNTDQSYRAGLDAMNRSMVLVVNRNKPAGWLDGDGDGTQVGDKGNAGNGTLKVLPAPPGEPYVSAGCSYFIMGAFDLDYVRSVSAGYGELTNDATVIDDVPVATAAERIARSDYVFVRIPAPFSVDPDSGALECSMESLEYASNDNAAVLDDIRFARESIDALPTSKTQIIVGVDAGRPSVVREVIDIGVSGLYVTWSVTDKVFLDVAFGIVDGPGHLPVGLPASDAAAALQLEDVAGDGQDPTFVNGFGLPTNGF